MDKIKMGNGATYDCSFFAPLPNGTLYVALPVDWAKAAQILANPSNTRRMEYGNYILQGYTDLADLSKQPYGIQAILKGGTYSERSV